MEETQFTEEMLDKALQVAMEEYEKRKTRGKHVPPEPTREKVIEWLNWHVGCPATLLDSCDPCYLTQDPDIVDACETLMGAGMDPGTPNDGCPSPEADWDTMTCWKAWLEEEVGNDH